MKESTASKQDDQSTQGNPASSREADATHTALRFSEACPLVAMQLEQARNLRLQFHKESARLVDRSAVLLDLAMTKFQTHELGREPENTQELLELLLAIQKQISVYTNSIIFIQNGKV